MLQGMKQKVETLLWYLFIFLLPFQAVWLAQERFVAGEKWHSATWGIYFSDIVLVLLVSLIIKKILVFRKEESGYRIQIQGILKKHKEKFLFFFFAFSFLLWTWISLLWSMDVFLGLRTAILYTLGFFALLVAFFGRYCLRITGYVFVLALSIHGVIGIGQFLVQYSPPLTLLGMAEHDPLVPGISVLKMEDERWLRAYGGFEHPNVFGGALVVAIFCVIGLWRCEKYRIRKIFLLIGGSIMTLALIMTFSRMAWLGVFFGFLGTLLYTIFQRRKFLKKKKKQSALFITLGIFFLLFVTFLASFRFSPDMIAREGSVQERIVYIRQSWELIKEHPFLGTGVGNFSAWSSDRYWQSDSYIAQFQPVHNIPLLLLSELGLIGLALALGGGIALVRGVPRSQRRWLIVFSLGLAPAFFFDHWLITSHFGMLVSMMGVGMLWNEKESNRI